MPETESAAALRDHLTKHLTDGRFHDQCQLCLNRRRFGGTGVTR